MLDVEELLELEDNIRKELDDHLPAALSMLNRTGELETFLKMLGMEDLLQSTVENCESSSCHRS